MSSLIILLANNLTIPEHDLRDQFDADNDLITEALQFFANVALDVDDESYVEGRHYQREEVH
jgi:hypothetical protein